MRGVWIGALVIGLLAACGKFGKDDGDTPASDGGTTPTGTSSSSSGSSGIADGGTADVERPEPGPHAPVDACHGTDLFCDLFDGRTKPEDGWDSNSDDEGDMMSIATDIVAQGTGSFRVDVKKDTENDHARLIKTVGFGAEPPAAVVLEFSFRAPASFKPKDAKRHLNLAYLTFNGDLALVVAQDGIVALNVKDDIRDYVGPGKDPYLPDQFNDVRLTVDIQNQMTRLVLNGVEIQSSPIVFNHGTDNVQVIVGPYYSDTESGYTVYFDAVRLTRN